MELASIDKAGLSGGDVAAIATADASPKTRNVETSATKAHEFVKNDAVAIELSSSLNLGRGGAKAKPTEATSDSANSKSEISAEKAEEIRSKLEGAINSTHIRFDVSIEEDGKSSLFFQVVDKDSGRVIRQFPPEELVDLGEVADQLSEYSSSHIDARA